MFYLKVTEEVQKPLHPPPAFLKALGIEWRTVREAQVRLKNAEKKRERNDSDSDTGLSDSFSSSEDDLADEMDPNPKPCEDIMILSRSVRQIKIV
jgi:hypothetical protein